MTTIKHSGDLGDIVYFMPVLKSYAATEGPVTFLLDPNQARHTGMPTRQAMTVSNAQPIIPLLRSQSYVGAVLPYAGQDVTIDGDDWRTSMLRLLKNRRTFHEVKHINLCEWQRRRYGVEQRYEEEPWITDLKVDEEYNVARHRFIINRSERYLNPVFPWKQIVEKYGKDMAFVGTQKEWEKFCMEFGAVPYAKTSTLLHVARLISKCEMFIGNQSACYAVAEGMKHNAIIEVYPQMPNCCFKRENVVHGWGSSVIDQVERFL